MTANGSFRTSGGDENILELDSGGVCTTLWVRQNHWTVYFKPVNFIVLSLNNFQRERKEKGKRMLRRPLRR